MRYLSDLGIKLRCTSIAGSLRAFVDPPPFIIALIIGQFTGFGADVPLAIECSSVTRVREQLGDGIFPGSETIILLSY